MLRRIFTLGLFLPLLGMVSCADDEGTDALAGIYVGSFNATDPSYQSVGYPVTVTRLSGNTIRITPSTSHGTEWTVTLMKISNSLYTCINCVDNQVTVNIGDTSTMLNYNYGDNSEQFSGTRQ